MIYDYLFYQGCQKVMNDKRNWLIHPVTGGYMLVEVCYMYHAFTLWLFFHAFVPPTASSLFYYLNISFLLLLGLMGILILFYYNRRWEQVMAKYDKLSKTWHNKPNPKRVIIWSTIISGLLLLVAVWFNGMMGK